MASASRTQPILEMRLPQAAKSLQERLEEVLPKDLRFRIFHLSTPPTKADALFHAPPDTRPDRTYCETHFLALSIDSPPEASASEQSAKDPAATTQVMVLGVEIYIFMTAFSTIFFVSKADSTGYLHLLGLSKGTPSPIREVTSTFITHLLQHRRRKDIQSVVSLFARAQPQYLFPGSVENSGKHVLDDRALVKWWCRVLNPMLETPQDESPRKRWGSIRGYLVVPGQDVYETRAFLPRTPSASSNWVLGDPLESISHYSREFDWVPPRCLIPRYPDDPKSRFRDELDTESSNGWTSVQSLRAFWELMAFRQECSSGRLTGFIWVVFTPQTLTTSANQSGTPITPALPTPTASFDGGWPSRPPATPPRRIAPPGATTPQSSPLKAAGTPFSTMTASPSRFEKKRKKKAKRLTGPIAARQPRIKTQHRNQFADRPSATAYYYWPQEGRGEKIVDESMYKRCIELLTHLDFSTLEKAVNSTSRWINEVGMQSKWGIGLTGRRAPPAQVTARSEATVNNLTGMVRKKRPHGDEGSAETKVDAATNGAGPVNLLGASLVRKKQRHTPVSTGAASDGNGDMGSVPQGAEEPKINVLTAGLVRKKPRTA
jgi:regulator of Ty1 transposition protein 109